jgi:hypothetical protein
MSNKLGESTCFGNQKTQTREQEVSKKREHVFVAKTCRPESER